MTGQALRVIRALNAAGLRVEAGECLRIVPPGRLATALAMDAARCGPELARLARDARGTAGRVVAGAVRARGAPSRPVVTGALAVDVAVERLKAKLAAGALPRRFGAVDVARRRWAWLSDPRVVAEGLARLVAEGELRAEVAADSGWRYSVP